MVRTAFSAQGKLKLKFIVGSMNAEMYIDVLERCLVPFLDAQEDNKTIFQQDNAPAYSAKTTKKWFLECEIGILGWTA